MSRLCTTASLPCKRARIVTSEPDGSRASDCSVASVCAPEIAYSDLPARHLGHISAALPQSIPQLRLLHLAKAIVETLVQHAALSICD